MKANELKLKNYVYFTKYLKNIMPEDIDVPVEEQEDCFEGVPITDELLVIMGFVLVEDLYTIDFIPTADLAYSDNALIIVDKQTADILTSFNNIKYVHQLQNIYHAITGDNLTVLIK